MKKEFANAAIEVVKLKKVDIITGSSCGVDCFADCSTNSSCVGTDDDM